MEADDTFVFLYLKLLMIRTEIEAEAKMYFESGIFNVLDSLRTPDAKRIAWVCWPLANVIWNVRDSVRAFFECGFFEFIENAIFEGEFQVKPAALMVLIRLIGRDHNFVRMEKERVLALVVESFELLLSGSLMMAGKILGMYREMIAIEETEGSRAFVDLLLEHGMAGRIAGFAESGNDECAPIAVQLCEILDAQEDFAAN